MYKRQKLINIREFMSRVKWIVVTPYSNVCRELGFKIHAHCNTLPQATKFIKTLDQQAFIKQDLKTIKL